MSLLGQTAALVRSELRSELRAGEVLFVIVPFGAIALLLVPMAIGTDAPLLARLGPGLYWVVVLLFGVLVTQRQTAIVGRAQRDLLRLLGVDPAARFFATAATATVLLLAFETVVGVVAIVLYGSDLGDAVWLIAVLPLVAAGLAMVGTLAGSIAVELGQRSSLAPLLVAPLAIPILLGAAQANDGLLQRESILGWLAVLLITDLVIALVGVLSARPLEETVT